MCASDAQASSFTDRIEGLRTFVASTTSEKDRRYKYPPLLRGWSRVSLSFNLVQNPSKEEQRTEAVMHNYDKGRTEMGLVTIASPGEACLNASTNYRHGTFNGGFEFHLDETSSYNDSSHSASHASILDPHTAPGGSLVVALKPRVVYSLPICLIGLNIWSSMLWPVNEG